MKHLAAPVLLAVLLAGCAGGISRQFADNLSGAVANQDDIETVRAGAPAFLLLVDGLIEGSPGDPVLLNAGSRLYGAYASAFVEDRERRLRLTDRALGYARRAICDEIAELCTSPEYPLFRQVIASTEADQVPLLYSYGAALAGWIQARTDDWKALARLPRVETLMQRVVELDEGYDHGRAHLYLGAIACRLPASLGGKPHLGQTHFEKAIALSNGQDRMAHVEYAASCARLLYDRELHDRLVAEVLESEAWAAGLTLSNALARHRAEQLRASANDYFGD